MKRSIIYPKLCTHLFITILILLLYGCNSNTNKVTSSILHSWNIIKIETKGNPLSITNEPNLYFKDSIEFYVNYNNTARSLIFYNLKNKSFAQKVDLFTSGPNKVSTLSIYNILDSTICYQAVETINLLNYSGEIINTMTLNDLCPELNQAYSLKPAGGINIVNLRRLFVDQNSRSIVFRTYNKENGYENIYKNPCFCEYSFVNRQGTAHRVDFPDELYREYYGDLEYPNIIIKGDSLIYNFPFKAAVYIYDKNTKKTTVKTYEANHIPTIVEGKSLSLKADMMLKATFLKGDKYHQIDYDPHTNLYYMLYSEKRIEDKPILRHLIVFDKNIEKLGEIDIDPEFHPEFAISKQGLLFRSKNDVDFDTLTLHVLNINVN